MLYVDFNSHHPVCHERSAVLKHTRYEEQNSSSTQKWKCKEIKQDCTARKQLSSIIYKQMWGTVVYTTRIPPADLPTNGFLMSKALLHLKTRRHLSCAQKVKPLKTVHSLFTQSNAQNWLFWGALNMMISTTWLSKWKCKKKIGCD